MKKKIHVNRKMSYFNISIFAISLIVFVVFLSFTIKHYVENKNLEEQIRLSEENKNSMDEIYETRIDENGYYVVYLDGEMVTYNNGDTVEIN